jgi:hypothetical protein
MLETTARPLSAGGPVVMFRSHARLQPGGQPGVNAVARETADLPRYLSFARSAVTLDTDPLFGFQWNSFLSALSGGTLPLVNPRPAFFDAQPLFGPGPAALPMGRVVPVENPLPLVNLDAAAAVVHDFVAAWEDHHGLAIRDGRVFQLEEGPVARVEAPVRPVLLVQGGRVVPPPLDVVWQGPVAAQPAAIAQRPADRVPVPVAPVPAEQYASNGAPTMEQLMQLQQQLGQQLQLLQELQRQQMADRRIGRAQK